MIKECFSSIGEGHGICPKGKDSSMLLTNKRLGFENAF